MPDGIREEVWADWISFRREIGHPLDKSKTSLKHFLRELDTLTQDGTDPNAILRQSIAKQWRGIFPLKRPVGGRAEADYNRNHPVETFQRNAGAALAALRSG